MKKTLLVVIDALASQVFFPAIGQGKLPNLEALSQVAQYSGDCISIFPSITPAATSSIITGNYPCQHTIAGNYWYDPDADRVDYFGGDIPIILEQGIGRFFRDFLHRMNHERLKSTTLFQHAQRAGLTTASVNYLIYRGETRQKFDTPIMLQLYPEVPAEMEVQGPDSLYYGDFMADKSRSLLDRLVNNRGPRHRFGFDDQTTADYLADLIAVQGLPDFTVAYFPDNDFDSHDIGPDRALATVQKVDSHLGNVFAAHGGVERMVQEFSIIITGDHAQCHIHKDSDRAGIDMDDLLQGFQMVDAGTTWSQDDQITVCPNLRATQIYFRHPTPDHLQAVCDTLLTDKRVDQVIWPERDFHDEARGYHVQTADGHLHIWRDGGPYTDDYGGQWDFRGDLSTVDAQITTDNTLAFGDYPNAFERIAGSLDLPNSGHLWVTAKPGYEFTLPGLSIHADGGSHSSLHYLDSATALIAAGIPESITLPRLMRLVDIAPLCAEILGIRLDHAVGESHV